MYAVLIFIGCLCILLMYQNEMVSIHNGLSLTAENSNRTINTELQPTIISQNLQDATNHLTIPNRTISLIRKFKGSMERTKWLIHNGHHRWLKIQTEQLIRNYNYLNAILSQRT